MNLLEHFRQLANFDEWANREVLTTFRKDGPPTMRSLGWMAHIVAAEHLWLARIEQQASPLPVWPELTLEECGGQAQGIAVLWGQLLSAPDDGLLDRLIAYKNSKGEAYESSVRDILTHTFNHSTYHRGQIAADMRQAGHVPAYTDFIQGVRQGFVK